jgi:hypothetical protein
MLDHDRFFADCEDAVAMDLTNCARIRGTIGMAMAAAD